MIIANWKANGDIESNKIWCNQLISRMSDKGFKSIGIDPSYIHFNQIKNMLKNNGIEIGFQDIDIEGGARTGSISPSMAADSECSFCLIGHSERREIFNDDNDTISKKYKMLAKHHIKPVLCIGESFEDFQAGKTEKKLQTQIEECTQGNILSENLIIAYEPVWAIGTGKTATDEMAQEAHAEIRRVLSEMFGESAASSIRILYGGSMKPENAAGLLDQPDVDGGLIGGASLSAKSFCDIVEAAISAS